MLTFPLPDADIAAFRDYLGASGIGGDGRRAYSKGARRFGEFWLEKQLPTRDPTRDDLAAFMAWLAEQGVSEISQRIAATGVQRFLAFKADPTPLAPKKKKAEEAPVKEAEVPETVIVEEVSAAGGNGHSVAPIQPAAVVVEDKPPENVGSQPIVTYPQDTVPITKPLPRQKTPRTRTQAPRNYFRNQLDNLLPTAERIMIWKRDELGAQVYVKDYGVRELAQFPTMEAFLQTYVVPRFGAGSFDVAVVNDGKVSAPTSFRVVDPRNPQGLPEPPPAAPPARGSSLKEELEGLRMLQEMVGQKGGPADPMTMIMLLEKLRPPPAPPPMPMMPPPAPPPGIDIAGLIAALAPLGAAVLQALKPAAPPSAWTMKDVLTTLPAVLPIVEKFTGKELLESALGELQEMREERKRGGGVKELVEQINALKTLEFFRPNQDADSVLEPFLRRWDSLPEKLDAIGAFLERKARIKEKRQLAAGAAATPATAGSAPTAGAGAAAPGSAGAGLRETFKKAVMAIGAATDDRKRIGATLESLRVFAKAPGKAAVVNTILAYVKGGEKDKAMDALKQYLMGLVEAKWLSLDAQNKTFEAFLGNYDKVVQTLKML